MTNDPHFYDEEFFIVRENDDWLADTGYGFKAFAIAQRGFDTVSLVTGVVTEKPITE